MLLWWCAFVVDRFPMDPFMDLQEVVNGLPQVLTGADLYSLCSNAYLCNVARNIQLIESGNFFG